MRERFVLTARTEVTDRMLIFGHRTGSRSWNPTGPPSAVQLAR